LPLHDNPTGLYLDMQDYPEPPHHLLDPFAGYERYLRRHDDGGWRRMTRPGTSGYGLLVCHYDPSGGYGGYNGMAWSLQNDDGTPWLVPALVDWVSLVDPATNRVYQGLRDHSGMVFPPVGVADYECLDGTVGEWSELAAQNMLTSDVEDAMDGSYETDAGVIHGVIPAVNAVQITEEARNDIFTGLTRAQARYQTGILSFTDDALWEEQSQWWQEYYYHLEPDEQAQIQSVGATPEDHGRETCKFSAGAEECRCGLTPTPVQLYQAITGEPDFALLAIPADYHPLWAHAVKRCAQGWSHIRDLAEEGDRWSISSLQRFSPYSGSCSPELQLQRLSEGSTSSARPLAS
jgi:hypothetical protein